jgi:hypothetical protein
VSLANSFETQTICTKANALEVVHRHQGAGRRRTAAITVPIVTRTQRSDANGDCHAGGLRDATYRIVDA